MLVVIIIILDKGAVGRKIDMYSLGTEVLLVEAIIRTGGVHIADLVQFQVVIMAVLL